MPDDRSLPALPRREWRAAAAVLVAGLVMAGAVTFFVQREVTQTRGRDLARLTDDARTAIERRIAAYAEVLGGLRGFLAVKPDATRREFHDYVALTGVTTRSPGARVVAFVRRVPVAEEDAFVEKVRRDTSLDPGGHPAFALKPARRAGERYVIDYVEPFAGNEDVFGFDIASEPDRRAALEEARDTGDLVASEPITLVQPAAPGKGFLLVLAVYRSGAVPVTAPARRRSIAGVVDVAFEIDTVVAAALGTDQLVNVEIYDVGPTVEYRAVPLDATTLLYDGDGRLEAAHPRHQHRFVDMDVGSRRWRLYVTAASAAPAYQRVLPWSFGGAVLVITGLVFAVVVSLSRSRRLAVRLATGMTAELRSANEQLVQADRLRSAFLGTISHELRTPLTAIAGFTRVLLGGGLSAEEHDDFLERVARNAEGLGTLVDELLDFNRLDRGAIGLQPAVIDLSDFVRSVCLQLETVLHGNKMVIDVDPGATMYADRLALTRVLTNLLTNAAKFSPRGSTIHVSGRNGAATADLIVDDEGPGVPDDERALVFERFFRGSHPGAVSQPGTGVGLAVVKELTERMGGSVVLAASPAGGARFVVRLPADGAGAPLSPRSAAQPPPG